MICSDAQLLREASNGTCLVAAVAVLLATRLLVLAVAEPAAMDYLDDVCVYKARSAVANEKTVQSTKRYCLPAAMYRHLPESNKLQGNVLMLYIGCRHYAFSTRL